MLYPNQSFVRLPVNETGRDFFIGDLHGCVPLLERLLKAVRFDTNVDRLFSVGDLIDHGPDSFGALQRLQDWPWFHAVLGNHEAMALGAAGLMRSMGSAVHVWMHNGGSWSADLESDQWTMVQKVLQGMPLAMEIPLRDGRRVGMVHAEVYSEGGWALVEALSKKNIVVDDDQPTNNETALIWARTQARAARSIPNLKLRLCNPLWANYLSSMLAPILGTDLVIAGHTVTTDYRPLAFENRLNIDTGAYWAGEGALTLVNPLTGWYWQTGWARGSLEVGSVVRRRLPKPILVADLLPTDMTAPIPGSKRTRTAATSTRRRS